MEQLLENWRKFLAESGFSRLYGHILDHDSAILSAFRDQYSTEDNYERSRELKAKLLARDYGVTKTVGSYIENFETPEAVEVVEQSLFVSNHNDDPEFFEIIAQLGEEYEQDAVLMIPQGGGIEGEKEAYLLGTSPEGEYPPYGKEDSVGKLKMGEEAEFMSKIKGRPFTFKPKKEELETYQKLSKNSRWSVKVLAEKTKK
tara:strand:+ start:841 stop:1443 length:603 start_codon:yes stop_codon:yes gene_type:complete